MNAPQQAVCNWRFVFPKICYKITTDMLQCYKIRETWRVEKTKQGKTSLTNPKQGFLAMKNIIFFSKFCTIMKKLFPKRTTEENRKMQCETTCTMRVIMQQHALKESRSKTRRKIEVFPEIRVGKTPKNQRSQYPLWTIVDDRGRTHNNHFRTVAFAP